MPTELTTGDPEKTDENYSQGDEYKHPMNNAFSLFFDLIINDLKHEGLVIAYLERVNEVEMRPGI